MYFCFSLFGVLTLWRATPRRFLSGRCHEVVEERAERFFAQWRVPGHLQAREGGSKDGDEASMLRKLPHLPRSSGSLCKPRFWLTFNLRIRALLGPTLAPLHRPENRSKKSMHRLR